MIRSRHFIPFMLHLAILAAWSAVCTVAQTAEIRLKPQAAAAASMVTLGDVSDVFSGDPAEADRLRAIELFPSPPQGRERFVRARELNDLLLLRGVSLAEHRLSGASQITVSGFGQAAPATIAAAASAAHSRRATARVAEAVKAYLMARVSSATPWEVDVLLPDALVRPLVDPATDVQVAGGQAPWVGGQQFDLRLVTPDGPQQAAITAEVSIPASFVVAARSLPRGTLLRESDLQLCHVDSIQDQNNTICSLEQAVGKETTRSIPAGKLVTTDAIQSPVFVRRGEVVTVHAHAAGIRIRTQGRACEDGSEGALVSIESLATRETFFARVCGVGEVEVYARAVHIANPQPPARSR